MIKKSIYDEMLQNNKIKKDSITLLETFSNDKCDEYDFFISYSTNDMEYAFLTKKLLESMYVDNKKRGYKIYLDFEDALLDHNEVSENTAKRLASIIEKCKSIIYIHSQNSKLSKWCPWELGLGQGLKKPISILELVDDEKSFVKQAYLEVYPTIERKKIKGKDEYIFWVYDRKNNKKYVNIRDYINGTMPYYHGGK